MFHKITVFDKIDAAMVSNEHKRKHKTLISNFWPLVCLLLA